MRLGESIKSFIYHLAAPLLRRILKGQVTGKQIKGTHKVLYYDKSQHLGFLFATKINYEPTFSRILLDQVKPGMLVFEIGANIGQYSLQISEKLGPTGKLICVEPDSDNFKWLTNNMQHNKCDNVILVN